MPDEASEGIGYHGSCYNRFNATPKSKLESSEKRKSFILRSETHNLASTSSGVLSAVCIFCYKARKRWKGMEVPLTSCDYDSSQEKVKEAAKVLGDEEMLAQIQNIDFHAKEVKYHNVCKWDYLNRARSAIAQECKVKTKASEIGVHQQAFELLLSYVQTSVVDNNRPEYLGSIHKLYCHYVDETVTDSSIEMVYPVPKTIGEKIIHAYGDKVKLDMRSKKQGLVL